MPGWLKCLPFPFLGLVGQMEMKLALLIAVINPLVSGVLLVGPRGTGKTTIVRSLVNLLPYRKAQRLSLRLLARRYRSRRDRCRLPGLRAQIRRGPIPDQN